MAIRQCVLCMWTQMVGILSICAIGKTEYIFPSWSVMLGRIIKTDQQRTIKKISKLIWNI